MGMFDSLKSIGAGSINPLAVIGTGLAMGGDLLAYKSAKEADETTREMNAAQLQLAREQMAKQEEFAKFGLRWRTEDARAAGLHPLVAAGASGASFSPVTAMMEAPVEGARAKAEMFRQMGQNVSRAAYATMTTDERAATALRLRGMDLDNQIKQAELDKLKNLPTAPVPQPGQPSADWQETSYPSVAYMRSPTGLVPIMPPNLAEALESDQTGQAQWVLRYRGGPNLIPKERPGRELLPRGAVGFIWNPKLQEWNPVSRRQLEDRGRGFAEQKHAPRYRSIGVERFLP